VDGCNLWSSTGHALDYVRRADSIVIAPVKVFQNTPAPDPELNAPFVQSRAQKSGQKKALVPPAFRFCAKLAGKATQATRPYGQLRDDDEFAQSESGC
jgi:hypothetical protein